ncbi:MAG TPA: ATP-binding protein [Terriglobia bacterium]|nr:ATP-binding protein [Terriglobia bacterium]
MRARSIRLRLTIWYFLVLLAGLGLFAAGTWLALEHRLIADVDQRLAQRARGLQSVFDALDADDKPELEDDINDFLKQTADNSFIEVRDNAGATIFSSPNHKAFVPSRPLAPGYSTFDRDNQSFRVLSNRMTYDGKPYDAVLAVPLTDVHFMMRDFRNLLLLMIPLVLMIACLGGYWISGRALAPVDEITRVAKSITVQNLSHRLVVPETSDELQRMSEAWNDVLQRLDTAVQRIRRFTADASHELRTPVALIRATAELALTAEREPEYYRASLSTIESEATRMTDLTESLLTLARTDSNSVDMPLGPADVNRIIAEVAALSRPASETRRITLNTILADSRAPVLGNEAGIRRLLFILLDNAFKHTASGGSVTLSTTLSDGKVTISVCDSGEGIAPEDLPHIFERFYRADRSRSSNGAGLGLSIAQMIADLHGSKIEVESKVGSGSCFRLSLNLQTQRVV